VEFKSFVQWLEEAAHLQKDIHTNISAMHLKRIAKADPEHAARFIIDHEGKMHGASATFHLHWDIAKHVHPHIGTFESSPITGAVGYNKQTGGFTHELYTDNHKYFSKSDKEHPKLTELKAVGIFQNKGNHIL
jgi:hypothetical protein